LISGATTLRGVPGMVYTNMGILAKEHEDVNKLKVLRKIAAIYSTNRNQLP